MRLTYLARLLACGLLLAGAARAQAQASGGVRIGTPGLPDASAVLDLSTTSKGLLPPRLSQAQRDAITSTGAPGGAALGTTQAGLTVYNTTTNRLNFWDGVRWQEALGSSENPAVASSVSSAAQTFAYSGSVNYYKVPAGCTLLLAAASGAQGGGGLGGQATAVLKVTPGEVLALVVGGSARTSPNGYGQPGGYNGGGAGAAAGGGATDVRRVAGADPKLPLGPLGSLASTLSQRLLVAGGGGGFGSPGNGGNGGGGTAASDASGNPGQGGQGGHGGQDGGYSGGGGGSGSSGGGSTSAVAGGGGGLVSGGGSVASGGSGSSGVGGSTTGITGGGGGGYYGGGSSGVGGAGGGGSSWASAADCLSPSFTGGVQTGNGQLVLTPQVTLPAPAFDATNLANLPGRNLPAKAVPFSDGSTLQADALNLSYDNVANRLGIGTSTPSQRLEVAGQVFSSSGGFRFPDNSVQTTATTATNFIQNGTSLQVVTSFNIYGTGTVGGQLTAGSANIGGNVGIGTSVPAAKLDVNGSLRLAVRVCPVDQTTAYTLSGADLAYSIFKVQNSAFAPSLTLPTTASGQVEGQELTILNMAVTGTQINGTNTDNPAAVSLTSLNSSGLHAVKYVWALAQNGTGYWVRVQ